MYSPELRRCPPPEEFLASYFGYEEPSNFVSEEVKPELPEFEE